MSLDAQVPHWAFPFVVLSAYALMFAIAFVLGYGLFRLNKVHFKIDEDGRQMGTEQ